MRRSPPTLALKLLAAPLPLAPLEEEEGRPEEEQEAGDAAETAGVATQAGEGSDGRQEEGEVEGRPGGGGGRRDEEGAFGARGATACEEEVGEAIARGRRGRSCGTRAAGLGEVTDGVHALEEGDGGIAARGHLAL